MIVYNNMINKNIAIFIDNLTEKIIDVYNIKIPIMNMKEVLKSIGGSGDIGYICDDNFKVDFIGIKNDDMIHANSQTCFISDKHFITINKFDNNLRTKIKNGICLNKYEKQELNRLLSLYNNMGYNIKV